jgi:hypothetical protein
MTPCFITVVMSPSASYAVVGDHMFCCGKTEQKASRACGIASLPFRWQQAYRLARVVANGVQLRMQATLHAADTARNYPFLSRLAVVLWAFRYVASIIRHSLAPCGCDNSRNILLKIPRLAQPRATYTSGLARPHTRSPDHFFHPATRRRYWSETEWFLTFR